MTKEKTNPITYFIKPFFYPSVSFFSIISFFASCQGYSLCFKDKINMLFHIFLPIKIHLHLLIYQNWTPHLFYLYKPVCKKVGRWEGRGRRGGGSQLPGATYVCCLYFSCNEVWIPTQQCLTATGMHPVYLLGNTGSECSSVLGTACKLRYLYLSGRSTSCFASLLHQCGKRMWQQSIGMIKNGQNHECFVPRKSI